MLPKIIAACAALLTSTGFIPQIIKGFRTKHVKDVSMMTLVFSSTGTFLWAVYGLFLKDMIIIVANIFTCLTVLLLILMKRLYSQG